MVIKGNSQNNTLSGASGGDVIYGYDGNDTLHGYAGSDQLYGGNGSDLLFGGTSADTVNGGEGQDTLDGGAGGDLLQGGVGDDVYYIDHTGDLIQEDTGIYGGVDVVQVDPKTFSSSWLSSGTPVYTLPGYVEVLTFALNAEEPVEGAVAINGTGNNLNNKLYGNAAANVLRGEGGDDSFVGRNGNDTLVGGEGSDTLRGGDTVGGSSGTDYLDGGTGDDRYYVEDTTDVIVENASAGVDTVSAAASYVLSANVEQLVLTGLAADGTGNTLGNRVYGSDASNMLKGMEGQDTLRGGGGTDELWGGTGNDMFLFEEAVSSSVDSVADFSRISGDYDRVAVRGTSFGLATKGTLEATYFLTVSGDSDQGTAAHGQFLFNTTTHTLLWDADGAGATVGIRMATFKIDLALGDMVVV